MTGHFNGLVEEYLAMRRSLGYQLIGQGRYLHNFANFLDRAEHEGPILLTLSVEWASSTSSPDPRNPARRLMVVRDFLRHLAARDGATEVPAPGLLGPTTHRTPPHIYCDDEIAELLREAARLSPHEGLRPHSYVTLFSLLACTGLRISEALALRRDDVDLVNGVITVRSGKNGRSRLVPLHPSSLEPLRAYAERCEASGSSMGSDAFFRSDHCDHLAYAAVHSTFKRLRERLGWTAQGRVRAPRIHDLRHQMVVRRVLLWHTEGVDVDVNMAALATYLGHVLVADLYWYFSATPELMNVVAERFSVFANQRAMDPS
jgi:integrase